MAKQATLFSFFKRDNASAKPVESYATQEGVCSEPLIEEESSSPSSTALETEDPITHTEKELQQSTERHGDGHVELLITTISHQDDAVVSDDEQNEKCNKTEHLSKMTLSDEYKLSDYELLRLRNIQRNHDRLVALGLVDPNSQAFSYNQEDVKKNMTFTKKRKNITIKNSRDSNNDQAIRRSTRNKHSETSQELIPSHSSLDHSLDVDNIVSKEEESVIPIFKDSPLVQYTMDIVKDSMSYKSRHQGPISSLSISKTQLMPPKSNMAWYSMDIRTHGNSEFIVAAGKGGIISLWNRNCSNESNKANHEKDDIEPILCWKGHGGRWISDAKFVSCKIDGHHLLSAANDGYVSLWDLQSINTTTEAPRSLATTGKFLHTGGIFSMDLNAKHHESSNLLVATGSKDKTVAVTSLESIEQGASCKPLYVSRFHTSKVGCVHMQGCESTLFGSASDDGSFAVHDYRTDNIILNNDTAHMKPHSFVWHPTNNNIFMTAGYDDCIKLWDIRSSREPLITCKGHVPHTVKNVRRIHRPAFLQIKAIDTTHDYILTGSENSSCLSIYECKCSNLTDSILPVYSRGNLPNDYHDDVCCITSTDSAIVYVSLSNGEIMILNPK